MLLDQLDKFFFAFVALSFSFVALLVVSQPRWAVAWLAYRSPEVLYQVETTQPVVALTFDDGPDPVTTPKILDLLQAYEARATFFIITERVPQNEAILQRLLAEDHELGNHLTVDQPSIKLPPAEFKQHLIEADGVLRQFAPVHWFRPGSGWYNAPMLDTIEQQGYRAVLGSIYPFDAHLPFVWFAVHHILWRVEPGSIIILHDAGSRGERTLKTLSAILPVLQQRGYRPVTLSELGSIDPRSQ